MTDDKDSAADADLIPRNLYFVSKRLKSERKIWIENLHNGDNSQIHRLEN